MITNKICLGFLAQCRRNEDFYKSIFWSDESTFTPNGVFNSRNNVYWTEKNSHVVRQGAFQYRWSINVWAGMIANQVVSVNRISNFLSLINANIFVNDFQIGPVFLPPRLNGENYLDFFENQLPVPFEDVPLHVRTQMIFQHYGASPHFRRTIRDFLLSKSESVEKSLI